MTPSESVTSAAATEEMGAFWSPFHMGLRGRLCSIRVSHEGHGKPCTTRLRRSSVTPDHPCIQLELAADVTQYPPKELQDRAIDVTTSIGQDDRQSIT